MSGYHLGRNCFVVRRRSDHGHVFEVFSCRPQHGGPTDVDVLHQFAERDARLPRRLFESVKIDHHHVDGFDVVFGHGRQVLDATPQMQNAPMYLGMQGFYPAIQHLWKTGKVGNIPDSKPGVAQGTRGTAGRNQFHVQARQLAGEIYQASLVRHTQKSPLNVLIVHSRPAHHRDL
jgi:hypothetical protein